MMLMGSEVGVAGIVNGGTVANQNMVVRREVWWAFLDGMEHLEGRLNTEGQHSRQDQQDNGLSLWHAEHHFINI